MTSVHSLPPVINDQAEILILGSMPGKTSLKSGQYYAHPQNLFWRLLEDILHISRSFDYQERCACLVEHRIGLWDTVKTCTRSSSLDSDILDTSIVVNNVSKLLTTYCHINLICFNGKKAEQIFLRHIAPTLDHYLLDSLKLVCLPSTSPANASILFASKLKKWSIIKREIR